MDGDSDSFDTGVLAADYDPLRPRPFDTPWGSFTIWRLTSGEWVARESFCPHLLGPLFQGSRDPKQDVLSCPWHAWRFSLSTGRCLHSPRNEGAGMKLAHLEVEVGPRGTLVLSKP